MILQNCQSSHQRNEINNLTTVRELSYISSLIVDNSFNKSLKVLVLRKQRLKMCELIRGVSEPLGTGREVREPMGERRRVLT
jgi:hypothetical protein